MVAESETVAEVKRLRKRVASLEEKAGKTEALEAEIADLKAKIKDKENPDFIDWDEPEEGGE